MSHIPSKTLFMHRGHQLKEKNNNKKNHCHDMQAIGEQGKDRNSCLGNSRKAYHATKAVVQHL